MSITDVRYTWIDLLQAFVEGVIVTVFVGLLLEAVLK